MIKNNIKLLKNSNFYWQSKISQLNKHFSILLLCTFLSSCATFSSKMVNQDNLNLNENNIYNIEGEYELFPDSGYTKKGESFAISSKSCCNSFYSYLSKKEIKYDSLATYSFKLKLINPEKIKFIFKKENTKIDSLEIAAKLNKNGFFDLDNKNLKRTGIPFLFGGYDSDKTRIGITKDNGLLVQYASAKFGGLLIVISLRTSCNSAFRFNRKENN